MVCGELIRRRIKLERKRRSRLRGTVVGLVRAEFESEEEAYHKTFQPCSGE